MNDQALKLFNDNYNNIGDTKDLEKHVKVIEKKFKSGEEKKIIYLPWATVERIFRSQGGKITKVNFNYSVKVDGGENYNPETGELDKVASFSNFVYLEASWQGETLEEYYPIFDSQTSRIVRIPDANQLNASRQRGMVRLIARISGIGLWIFEGENDEQHDKVEGKLQEETQKQDTKQLATKSQITRIKKLYADEIENLMKFHDVKALEELTLEQASELLKEKTKKREESKKEKDDVMSLLLGNEEETEVVEKNVLDELIPKKEEKAPLEEPKIEPKITFTKDSEEHSDKLLELKKYVPTHREEIRDFIAKKGKTLLRDLEYDEIVEILKEIEG